MIHKTAARNRKIFAAYHSGETVEGLAEQFKLSTVTVRQIIDREKHNVAVSPDAYYEAFRQQVAPNYKLS